MKQLNLILFFLLSLSFIYAQPNKFFELKSPDGKITLKVEAGSKLIWSVLHEAQKIIIPSEISLQLANGHILGENVKITSSKKESVNTSFAAINYKKATIIDNYNLLKLNCKGDYCIIFRVYNDGVAYRFITKKKGEIIVKTEKANFNFAENYKTFVHNFAYSFHNCSKCPLIILLYIFLSTFFSHIYI